MSQNETKTMLYDAIQDRARIYLEVFRVLETRYGETEAVDVMRAASHAHGVAVGQTLAHLAPGDFEGMAARWVMAPDDGATFCPDVMRLDANGLEVRMMRCPLKDAWFEAGCSEAQVATLLYCASAFDEAALTGAGFDFELRLWQPGQPGCCHTRIMRKPGT